MAQHDMDVANAAGAAFRADLNDALAALVSDSSGATAPATTFAYMWWADTTTGILKRRNSANSAWISVMSLATGLIIGTDVQAYDANTAKMNATITMSGAAINEAPTLTVASATTTNIGAAASNNVDISGTTTITAFDTVASGINRYGRFTGALTLTHNATSLILPGGVNITTAANDCYEARSLGSGNWIVTKYTRASGLPIVSSSSGGITLGTPVASTSGTSIDFTGLPAGTKRVTINFSGVSTNGTGGWIIQIGDSGGIENTGYLGAGSNEGGNSWSNYTTGFGLNISTAATVVHGWVTLCLENSSANTWTAFGMVGRSDSNNAHSTAGAKSLSAALDRVRITTVAGTDAFDAGEINISYE